MWANESRSLYDRSKLRYPSDLTDEEWALVEPLIPSAKRGSGKRTVAMREVVNGVMHILSTGCQLRALPRPLELGWNARTHLSWSLYEMLRKGRA